MIRVLIVDDAPAFRGTLRAVLEWEPEIEIVGEAEDGDEAIALAVELRPDVVLMDVRMPVLNGFAATRRIRELVPEARVIALTAYDEQEVVTAMIAAGASAYCVKGAPTEELSRTIAAACGRGDGEDGVVVWVNSSGSQTPIHLPAADVAAALPGAWAGVESGAGEGLWCVLRRAPA